MSYGDGLYGVGLYGGTPVATILQDNVFPPRVLVTVTGLVADDITEVTIYRVVGTDRVVLRGANALDTTGIDAVVRVDGEQPFGVPFQYLAELTDADGVRYEAYSATLTVQLADARYVISDAINALGAKVVVESWPEKRRTRQSATFNVGGRMVVVSSPRSSASATLRVRTETVDDGVALGAVLDTATSGVVQVRQAGELERFDAYLAIPDDTEDRQWWGEFTWWTLEAVETETWPPSLEARGFTLQDIADMYTPGTLQDLANDFDTLLALAQGNFAP